MSDMKTIFLDKLLDRAKKISNSNQEMVQKTANCLGLTFINEKEFRGNVCFANNNEVRPEFRETFSQRDLLNYCYAILASTKYRNTNLEFLKADLSNISIPTDSNKFWKLVQMGKELGKIHSEEDLIIEQFTTHYHGDGDNIVCKPSYVNSPPVEENFSNVNFSMKNAGRIYINENQYFDLVPEEVWYFYIDGQLPAQQWLDEHKELQLSREDVLDYQKTILILTKTIRIIKEIDTIKI